MRLRSIAFVLILIVPCTASAADIIVDSTSHMGLDQRHGLWGPYWVTDQIGALIFIDTFQRLLYSRTTDGGATWSSTVFGSAQVRRCAVWFDKETPGDTGDEIHVAWLESNFDDAIYRAYNISTDTFKTQRFIDTTNTVSSTAANNRLSITKTKSGNVIAVYSTQSEVECYKSSDQFATTPTACADIYETATQEDWVLLFPANTTDDNDAMGMFWDRSANQLSVKMYDDSADTWTEKTLSPTMTDDTQHINMDGAVRHSDGHLLFAAHSNDDNASDDLLTFDINANSISAPSTISRASIFVNTQERAQVGVIVNQQNDDVYLAYFKGGTWQSTVDVVYHKSTDGMVSWGTEQAFSQGAADDRRIMNGTRSITDDGGIVMWSWFNDDIGKVVVNVANSISISAVTTTTTTLPSAARRVFVVQ